MKFLKKSLLLPLLPAVFFATSLTAHAADWAPRKQVTIVAVSGAGLADSQFPQYMCDTPEIADIQHSDSLVLHGVFCGVTFNY